MHESVKEPFMRANKTVFLKGVNQTLRRVILKETVSLLLFQGGKASLLNT